MQEAPLFDDSAPLYAPIVPMTPDAELRRLGGRLPRGIYLGSSSWNFPGWRGIVWGNLSSVTGLAERGLTAYAAYPVFRTAGIDRSYYRPLPTATYRQFADEVPDGFRFLVKAPQSVTDSQLRHPGTRRTEANPHYLDLKEAVETFVLPAAEGLGEKLGVLIFEMAQLPRELVRGPANAHRAIDEITSFLSELPQEHNGLKLTYGVEMRTHAIFTRRYIRALRPTGVRPVIGIHPTLPSVMRQINALKYLDAPDVESGPWQLKGDAVVRWSLADGGTFDGLKRDWSPFSALQEPNLVNREAIAWLMDLAHQSGVRGFAVANNKAEGCSPLTMRAIAESIEMLDRQRRIY